MVTNVSQLQTRRPPERAAGDDMSDRSPLNGGSAERTVLLVCGARPNFMKVAPLHRAMVTTPGFRPVLVHTGQHFDREMSAEFFDVLRLPAPDVHLGVGQSSPAGQISLIVAGLERVIQEVNPDVTVVVGDVTSTLAGALASSAMGVPVAHVEAGLRSRDRTMPEERNRVLTDHISDYLFAPSSDACDNLRREGIAAERIFRVGNIMIDSLDWMLSRVSAEDVLAEYGLAPREFGLVTLHRASNVDDPEVLARIAGALREVSEQLPLVFPVHPRTASRLESYGIDLTSPGLTLLRPVSYERFVALLSQARLVLTDSGGIQEEALVLGVPCITLRENTERPVTLAGGHNELVGADPARIVSAVARSLLAPPLPPVRPPLWDGRTAARTVETLAAATWANGTLSARHNRSDTHSALRD